jgi:dephospho-CoA kinase
MGAGKSTVAAMLAGRGAAVIDVDALGREVLEPGGEAYTAVVARFGPVVVAGDGRIDRAALAGVVFDNPAALADLQAISHPAINRVLDRLLDGVEAGVVVLDMAILVESHLGRDLPSGRGYDTVVVVEAPLEVRVARLVSARGVDEADARARVAAQASDEARRAVADHVIVNDGDLAALEVQVDALWRDLCV